MERGTSTSFIFFSILGTIASTHGDLGNKHCTDGEGKIIPHGEEYTPNLQDPCTRCKCDNDYPILCHTAACSAPQGCARLEPIPAVCCQYHCLDANGNVYQSPPGNISTTVNGSPGHGEDSVTNLSLRLVASTVTSFLVLALLLFMVHRLRQRRLLLAMRRFEAQARRGHSDDDMDSYLPSPFIEIECPPYEDPPPPYSPPKPPHILPEDDPPPYREVENTSSDLMPLDSNANISNNNNNDDHSCTERVSEGNQLYSSSNQNDESLANLSVDREVRSSADSVLGSSFHRAQGDAHTEEISCTGRGSADSKTQAYLKSADCEVRKRESIRTVERLGQSSFYGNGIGCADLDQTDSKFVEPFLIENSSLANSHPSTVTNGEPQCLRQPSRSCSFSYSHNPEHDLTNGIVLAPMSQSYHASMTDSGVQTPSSYMASLTRRKAKLSSAKDASPGRCLPSVDGLPGTKRMMSRPIVGYDNAFQQNHRLLQEELRQNLPPLHAAISDETHPRDGSLSEQFLIATQIQDSFNHSVSFPGMMPRSQSMNSTFSVCSETGEKRVRKSAHETDDSVLQNDLQYPENCIALQTSSPNRYSVEQEVVSLAQPDSLSVRFNLADNTISSTKPNGSHIAKRKLTSNGKQNSRKPVSNPPSQELRPSLPTNRFPASKCKHIKKMGFTPLDKYRSSKDKGIKKGSTSESFGIEGPQQRTLACEHVQNEACAPREVGDHSPDIKLYQSRPLDSMNSRSLPITHASLKQYGFLENFPLHSYTRLVADDFEPTRYPEYGEDSCGLGQPVLNPYSTLPSQLNGHSLSGGVLTGAHHRQASAGDKGLNRSPQILHPKPKLRPYSIGPTVEPGYDSKSSTVMPHNSIPRRKVRNVRSKKSRQSYPSVLDRTDPSDKKSQCCVDVGVAKPIQCKESCEETLVASKRSSSERNPNRAVNFDLCEPSLVFDAHLSSYV